MRTPGRSGRSAVLVLAMGISREKGAGPGLPNEMRLSCGALKKDSFLNLRAPPASSAC